jgi:spermidine/putrescine transport system permease protein
MTGAALFRAYAVFYLVFLFAPIILLPMFAFNDATIVAFPLTGFTTKWFAELATNVTLHRAVQNSLIIAVSAAVISTALGILAARAATRFRFPMKGGIVGLIMLPLVLPEIIVSISLLIVLLALGISLSILTVILGHVLICTPFCIAILNSAFASLDRNLEEAAIDLGETRLSTFRLVILPLVAPGIIASLLISFTISLDDFLIAFFLAGTDPTLPVYIFSQFRFPHAVPEIMALGTILVALSILLLAIAEYVRRRGAARTGAGEGGGL